MVSVSLKISAIEGWEFLGWSGDYVSLDPKLSWEVKAPAHLVATFGTTLNTVATGGGKIALEPAMKVYPYGSKVRVMAIPDLGYGLSLWGGAGVGQTQNEWTLTITNARPKIAALFGPVRPIQLNRSGSAGTIQFFVDRRTAESPSDGA